MNSKFSLTRQPLPSDMFCNAYRSFFVVLIFSALFSCSKDNGPAVAPAIELVADSGYIANETLVVPGTLMSFKVEMKQGSERLTNFYIEVASSGQAVTRNFDTAMFVGNLIWTGRFYKSPVSPETWTFVVRDRQGGQNRVELIVLADTGSVYGPVVTLGNIGMGAQGNDQPGGFYSFESQEVFTISEAKFNQELIDLVFYFGEDELTMASPGANIEDGIFAEGMSPVNWEIRNSTRYMKTALSNEDFNNANSDSLMIALYIDAEGKRKAKNLVGGDIYVFKDQQSRLGLFRVNSVSGTVEGVIDLDIKIQSGEK